MKEIRDEERSSQQNDTTAVPIGFLLTPVAVRWTSVHTHISVLARGSAHSMQIAPETERLKLREAHQKSKVKRHSAYHEGNRNGESWVVPKSEQADVCRCVCGLEQAGTLGQVARMRALEYHGFEPRT